MSEKILDFDCPGCHVKIPVEYLHAKTRFVQQGPREILCCYGCARKYENEVLKVMREKLAAEQADAVGLTAEAILAIQDEIEYYKKEDERLVDDEVDMKDAAKAKKIFRDNRDPYEQRKPPLQIMQERFFEGMRKSQEKKIRVPVRSKLILPGDKNFKMGKVA